MMRHDLSPLNLARRTGLGLGVLAMLAAAPALAQDAPPPDPGAGPGPHHGPKHDKPPRPPMARITVTGEGTDTAAPDMARISVGVSVQAASAAEAMAQNAAKIQPVIAKLKAEGVEARDIQTSGLSLSPVQEYPAEGKPPVISGYVARNEVTLRVRDVEKLGDLLDLLVDAGANEINNIALLREDTTKAEDGARAKAVAAARHRAEVTAEAAGMRLGPLLAISDTDTGAIGPIRLEAMAASRDATPVEAGELAINASVTLTFGLLPQDVPPAPDAPPAPAPEAPKPE